MESRWTRYIFNQFKTETCVTTVNNIVASKADKRETVVREISSREAEIELLEFEMGWTSQT